MNNPASTKAQAQACPRSACASCRFCRLINYEELRPASMSREAASAESTHRRTQSGSPSTTDSRNPSK